MEPFPLDSLNDQEQVECFRIFSQLLGRPVAQKWDGTMMYDVTDTSQPYSYGVRESYTNVELPFHDDNAVSYTHLTLPTKDSV